MTHREIDALTEFEGVSALFVRKQSIYHELGLDCWPENRDARLYRGPNPVIAHPPCKRWGRYATGGPNPNARRRKVGDDGGCFAAALQAVRIFGGVLEHPAHSKAWAFHGLEAPPSSGGWVRADAVGWTCQVEQGHYGHTARKATWLYAVSDALPDLKWGPSKASGRFELSPHSREEARELRGAEDYKPPKRLTAEQREGTPRDFAQILVRIAVGASNSNGDATLLNQYRDRCERYVGELGAALQALGQIQGKVCPDEVMPAVESTSQTCQNIADQVCARVDRASSPLENHSGTEQLLWLVRRIAAYSRKAAKANGYHNREDQLDMIVQHVDAWMDAVGDTRSKGDSNEEE